MIVAYRILIGNPEKEKLLTGRRREGINKMNIKAV
jgi:hypothetical protein